MEAGSTSTKVRQINLLLAVLLTGCATSSDVRINPTRIHMAADAPLGAVSTTVDPSIDQASVKAAEALPAVRYFEAMNRAKSNFDDRNKTEYVEAGITIVQAYCLRWFQRMSDQGIIKGYTDGNVNVIRQLGTALLGIGKANSIIVSSYGAGNTAYEGLSKNFDDSFLLAPNSRKVKNQILNLLDAQADVIRGQSKSPKNFDQAYITLERYADLCTHSTAREIINDALDQGTAKLTEDGKVRVQPSDKAIQEANEQGKQTAIAEKAKAELERDGLKSALDASTKNQSGLAGIIQGLSDQLRDAQKALADERAKARTNGADGGAIAAPPAGASAASAVAPSPAASAGTSR